MFDVSQHLDKLNRNFTDVFHHVVDTNAVPEHWKDYCSDSLPQRLSGVRSELRKIALYFPQTAKGLGFATIDVFLAQNKSHGLCRFFITQTQGETHLTYSRQPKSFADTMHDDAWNLMRDHAPESLVWVYNNVMDGLTDIYDFSGFKSSISMTVMGSDTASWSELPWYKEFSQKIDVSKMVEVLSSGGGSYLMLDLSKDLRTIYEPQALLIDAKDHSSVPESVDFFPYLDEWMDIGLAETDL